MLWTPLRYGGEYQDSESGLTYLRARYYDPATAQFLTLDPAVDTTRSPYAYVADNPLNDSDPSGLCWGPGCWLQEQLNKHGFCTLGQDNCQTGAQAFANSSAGERANAIIDRYSFGLTSAIEGAAGVSYNHCDANWIDAHDSLAGTLAEGVGTWTVGAGGRLWAAGRELTIPFTNGIRVGLGVPGALTKEGEAYWAARLPHFHMRILDDVGNIVFRGGIKWHRPWE